MGSLFPNLLSGQHRTKCFFWSCNRRKYNFDLARRNTKRSGADPEMPIDLSFFLYRFGQI